VPTTVIGIVIVSLLPAAPVTVSFASYLPILA
jgi:hypothetical protein